MKVRRSAFGAASSSSKRPATPTPLPPSGEQQGNLNSIEAAPMQLININGNASSQHLTPTTSKARAVLESMAPVVLQSPVVFASPPTGDRGHAALLTRSLPTTFDLMNNGNGSGNSTAIPPVNSNSVAAASSSTSSSSVKKPKGRKAVSSKKKQSTLTRTAKLAPPVENANSKSASAGANTTSTESSNFNRPALAHVPTSVKRRNPFSSGCEGNERAAVKAKTDKSSPFDMSALMVIMQQATAQSAKNQDKENVPGGFHCGGAVQCDSLNCHVCHGGSKSFAPCVQCDFCERKTCDYCLIKCDKCHNYFCRLCSTSNYDQREDRYLCLSCNDEENRKYYFVTHATSHHLRPSKSYLFPLKTLS